MSNYRFALIVAVSVVIGIVIGVTGASLFWSKFNGESNMSNLSSRTQADIGWCQLFCVKFSQAIFFKKGKFFLTFPRGFDRQCNSIFSEMKASRR